MNLVKNDVQTNPVNTRSCFIYVHNTNGKYITFKMRIIIMRSRLICNKFSFLGAEIAFNTGFYIAKIELHLSIRF